MPRVNEPVLIDSFKFLTNRARALLITTVILSVMFMIGKPSGQVEEEFLLWVWMLTLLVTIGTLTGFLAHITSLVILLVRGPVQILFMRGPVQKNTLQVLSVVLAALFTIALCMIYIKIFGTQYIAYVCITLMYSAEATVVYYSFSYE
jgi:hypothetical protein